MKLLLILSCVVMYHYCNGYPDIGGEITKEIVTGNDTSVEYFLDTTNGTLNGSHPHHGFFKKVGGGIKEGIKSIKNKIGNLKNKIGSFKDNSGSGKRSEGGHYIGGISPNSRSGSGQPKNLEWILMGIGLIIIVTVAGLAWYYYQTHGIKIDPEYEVQQVSSV